MRHAALVTALGVGLLGCARASRPDIVVVTLDTVRADRLGCYGSTAGLTPHLDALAARGMVFDDASCSVPVTLPSHATLFTGRYPTATGVRNNGSFVVPENETTLAERLRDAGWRTGAVVAAFPLQSRYGLAQGFDVYDDDLPPLRPSAGAAFSVHFNERDAKTVTDRALALWSRLKGGPRFLWVHYFDAHAPYAPPEPWAGRHAGDPYGGEIAYLDAELGRLLATILRDAPQAIVIVVADHGEGLGEHGEKTHGVFLYQSTVHVPFLLIAPGRVEAGQRIAEPVSLADVLPTTLALAGLEPQREIDGTDLLKAVDSRREVYAESYLPMLQFRFSPLTMLRDGRLKFIDAPVPELYDLAGDPQESANLAATGAIAAPLAARLADFVRHADPEAVDRAAGRLDAESEARLRALGYAASGAPPPTDGPRGRDPKAMVDYLQRYDHAVGLVSSGHLDEGLAELRILLPEAPENYMAGYQLAAGLLASGRTDEARQALERVVAVAPEFGSGQLMLAECLVTLGHLDNAVEHFESAARLMPTVAEPKLAEGRALEARGRFDEAARAYLDAIQREPDSWEPVRSLIALRAGRGDLPQASREIEALQARFAKSAALPSGLADVRRREGNTAGAAEAIRHALTIDPASTVALMLQASMAIDAGHADQAIEAYRAVLRAKPGLRPARVGLGRALAVGGPPAEANAWIAQLETENQNDADAIALRGLLFERLGDPASAEQSYRGAIAIDARCVEARRGLERLSR